MTGRGGLTIALAAAATAAALTPAADAAATERFDLQFTGAPRVAADLPKSRLTGPVGLGDVNGDGRPDWVARLDPPARNRRSRLRVVFAQPPVGRLRLSRQPGFDVRVPGNDLRAVRYERAGDVNGDGLADLIVTRADRAFVIFGSAATTPVRLSALGTRGTTVAGLDVSGRAGSLDLTAAGYGAGDLNGDALDDLVVGSPGSDPEGRSQAGSAFVVYGTRTPEPVDVRMPDPARGYRIDGAKEGDHLGFAGAQTGDVNGDGQPDLLVAGERAQPEFPDDPAFVVLKQGATDLATTPGDGAYRLNGVISSYGVQAAPAGDVNGDGLADLLVGSEYRGGRIHLVFGSPSTDPVDLADSPQRVTTFTGASGTGVAGPGDVTGDGLADLLMGGAYPGDHFVRGARDLPPTVKLTQLGARGFALRSAYEASELGDADGDGRADLLVAAGNGYRCSPESTSIGSVYTLLAVDLPPRIPPQGRYTRESDTLRGAGGDDTMFGARGNDRLYGGRGADCLTGGADDYYDAESGSYAPRPDDDRLFGGPGDDYLDGGAKDDLLVGGRGDDVLYGGYGHDRVLGGPGDDQIEDELVEYVAGRHDFLSGGAGDDYIESSDGNDDSIDCGPGRDRALVEPGDHVRGCERVSRRRGFL
jgi:hypothetical protein